MISADNEIVRGHEVKIAFEVINLTNIPHDQLPPLK